MLLKKLALLLTFASLSFSALAQQPNQERYFTEAEYGKEAATLNTFPAYPGFSCGGKLSTVESMICKSPELSIADRIMSTSYKNEMSQATEEKKQVVKNSQLAFLKERGQCTTPDCILQKTQKRVGEFTESTEPEVLAALNKLKVSAPELPLKTPIEYFNVVGYHMCIYGGGKLKCSSFNVFNEEEKPAPNRVEGLRKISMSGTTVCLLANNGLNCYGYCKGGKICDVPKELKNGEGVTDLAVGKEHACVIKNGKVICWGDNESAQCNVPEHIKTPKQISAGVINTCVITDVGSIECWGRNTYGTVNVPKLSVVAKKVNLSGLHACALLENGEVSCWGINEKNDLKGLILGQSKPPLNNNEFTDISVGRTFNCGVRQSTMVCWGDQKVTRDFPKNLTGVKKVGAGDYHVCALLEDGVSCWGKYEDANGHWLSAERYRPITLD